MRRRKRVFSRLDPALVAGAARWADEMGDCLRELTPEAADVGAAMYVQDHPAVALEDASAVFRKEAEHRTRRIEAARARLTEELSHS